MLHPAVVCRTVNRPPREHAHAEGLREAMARKVTVQLVDDLDGTTSDTIETVTFGLDGVNYEIDLNEDNASNLRDSLADFIASATRTGGRSKRGTASAASRSATAGAGRTKEQTQ